MQVICSQMDFTHLQSNFFLSLAKNGSAKHFFFFFAMTCTIRPFSTSSCFHRLLIPPFSAETMEGSKGDNGRFGRTSEKRGGTEGVREGKECVWDARTHTQANSQTEGGWQRGKGHIGRRSGSLFLCVCVFQCEFAGPYGSVHTCTHTHKQSLHHGQSGSCLSLHSPLRHY